MSTKKGIPVMIVYELDLTDEQAAYISDLDVQIFWSPSDRHTLRTQLSMINGVYDVEYDMVNVQHGVTLHVNMVNDTDALWTRINKTVETYCATPLAIEPDEEDES